MITLKQGWRGADVRRLQEALNRKLSPSPALVPDGDYGPRTRAAVLDAGADEFLAKSGNSQALLAAINRLACNPAAPRAPQAAHTQTPDETLTKREQQVLALAAQGATAIQIAAELHISPFTARKHRENLMRKLALHNTAELVAYAMRLGLPTA